MKETDKHAATLWEYLVVNDELEKSDVIIGLGGTVKLTDGGM